MSPVEHAAIAHKGRVLRLRDLAEGDLDAIVRYWREGGADLGHLGVNLEKLGPPANTRKRFHIAIPSGDPEQRHLAFAITCDGAFIGYTVLDQYTTETNYSHWHVIDPAHRASGVSSALYPYRIKTYFDTTNMARLIHQTRTRNIGVNRMLDKFVRVAVTAYVEKPEGFADPGEFHMRYVRREDVPRIFARAAELARTPPPPLAGGGRGVGYV
jgi:hypothetical protein